LFIQLYDALYNILSKTDACIPLQNGAEANSVYYSFIETIKENNINPYQYIKFLFEGLPAANFSDLEALMPWSDNIPDYYGPR